MDEEFKRYIAKRCEEALIENEEYIRLERSGATAEKQQEIAEILCYIKGASDAMKRIFKFMQ